MKSNKITHTIAFFIIGLFTFVSSQAQEAKTLFINVPDSLCPLLTKAVSYTHLTLPTTERV